MSLAFTAPLLLWLLLALPLLWWLLRAVPPAPRRMRFAGIGLLAGLVDDKMQTARTPWWLLALRIAALGLAIVGFAGPHLAPRAQAPAATGALLVLVDGSWAQAGQWPELQSRLSALADAAGAAGRPIAVVALTDPPEGMPVFAPARDWQARIGALSPAPYGPDFPALGAWIAGLEGVDLGEVVWLSDGLAHAGRAEFAARLDAATPVLRVIEPQARLYALAPLRAEGAGLAATILRMTPDLLAEDGPALLVEGRDPAGQSAVLWRVVPQFAAGQSVARVALDLPVELRNRATRLSLEGQGHAGAVQLADDSLARREIALIAGGADEESQRLLSPLHYLREALRPNADLIEGALGDLLAANPDVLIMADIARLSPAEARAVSDYVQAGGVLLRFAGPRMAANSQLAEDALLPVRLRTGGRALGGAMSWDSPRALAPFAPDSPFAGLVIPDEVTVTQQVLAEPDPQLASHVIAALEDGTPFVTRAPMGAGAVVLFHVTANAEWSNLPLSGLFVAMLDRLAVTTRPLGVTAGDGGLAGIAWRLSEGLDGYGRLSAPRREIVAMGASVQEEALSATNPPGLYAGGERVLARNVVERDDALAPALWPASIAVERDGAGGRGIDLAPYVLTLGLVALMADILASLWITGRLARGGLGRAALLVACAGIAGAGLGAPRAAFADDFGLFATRDLRLAYVVTGDARVDEISRAGLFGLSNTLWARTTIEPEDPVGLDLERDELAFFPLLYWPVTADQPTPSEAAYARLNAYLRGGGMIVFDTQDGALGDWAGTGGGAGGMALRRLAAGLDIPPLAPVPPDHVLSRAYYLLQEFPGRHAGRDVWVEAPLVTEAQDDMVAASGFRRLNDGVTPVVIGANDWAGAWAQTDGGAPLLPVGRGFAGERQREIALRFGVNLVMHVLSGNYKSDQVHVPELLQRLGN